MSAITSIQDLLGLTAAGAAISLNMSPFLEALEMRRSRSVGARSPVPFAMIATNGLIWSVYGVILRNWVPIVAAYSIGIAGGVTALVAFETAASTDKGLTGRSGPTLALKFLAGYTIFSLLLLAAFRDAIASGDVRAAGFVGRLGVLSSIGTFASPLISVRKVIQSRSTASLSAAMTAASLACSGLWFLYGLLVDDFNLSFPSGVGLISSLFQVGLFVYFGQTPPPPAIELTKLSA